MTPSGISSIAIVVPSVSIIAFDALPSTSDVILSSESPRFSSITVAPVKRAMSSNISFLLSPKEGGSITLQRILPFTKFIANAEMICWSQGAMSNNDWLDLIANSKIV